MKLGPSRDLVTNMRKNIVKKKKITGFIKIRSIDKFNPPDTP